MFQRTVFILLFTALGIGTAAAGAWKGAGWYGVADWGWIETGPFQDKASCDASLPPDEDDIAFYCEYLSTQPSWDE